MAENNAVCTEDSTCPGTVGGAVRRHGRPMTIGEARTCSLVACLFLVSLLSNVVIGEIAHGLRSGSDNSLASDRNEYLATRLFGTASAGDYDANGGGSGGGGGSGKRAASPGEGRMFRKERGKRETGRKRRQRSNERSRASGEEESRGRNPRCSSCDREEMRAYYLEAIKGKILSKMGMSQPPNLNGRPVPKIGPEQLAAFLNRERMHDGVDGVVWIFQDGLPSDPHGDFSNERSSTNTSEGSTHAEEADATAELEDDYHVRTEKIVTFAQQRSLSIAVRQRFGCLASVNTCKNKHQEEEPTPDAMKPGFPSGSTCAGVSTDSLSQDPRVGHSPRVQFFEFSENVRSSRVKRAVLWVYIRGEESVQVAGDRITISIYRIDHVGGGRKNVSMEPVITSVLDDLGQYVPKGKGAWITLDYLEIKKLVAEWFTHPRQNLGIIITADDANRTNLAVTSPVEGSTSYVPFLELYVADNRKHRVKRNVGLSCTETSNESRCCRYPLRVDFEEFGWNWIIAPRRYEANVCFGECPFVFLTEHPHTHLMQLANVPGVGQCCSPRKLSDLYMMYFDQNLNIVQGMVPGMVVERCGCD